MNSSLWHSRRPGDTASQLPAPHRVEEDAGAGYPSEKEMLGQIGIILAVHLAAVLAIVVALRAFGLA